MRSLKDERKSLERDLLTAQGNTAALRALDIAGYNVRRVAAYDYNKALREQIDSTPQREESRVRCCPVQQTSHRRPVQQPRQP